MFSDMKEKGNPADLNRKILSQLIDRKLILQQSGKLDIKVKKKDIDQAVDNVLQRNKINLKKLKEGLAMQETTLEEYRQMMKEEIIIITIMEQILITIQIPTMTIIMKKTIKIM